MTETVSETSVGMKHDGDGIWNVGYETWRRRYLKRRLLNVTETVSETSVMKYDGDGLWNVGYDTWHGIYGTTTTTTTTHTHIYICMYKR